MLPTPRLPLRGLVASCLTGAASILWWTAALAANPAAITAGSPAGTIGPANPVASIPVDIARDSSARVLAFSVRLRLSAGLTLAPAGVTEGTFLADSGRGTSFQVVDEGGGIYTVDGATLSPDCGPEELTGRLFDLAVQSAAPGGLDSVTIVSVRLRDCANDDLPATIAGGALVPVDNTDPTVAVTAPNGGETWMQGTVHAITWAAADAAGVSAIALEYSTDNGGAWTTIATGEANDGTYDWTMPSLHTTQALVRVTALDANGNEASDASDATFSIVTNFAPVLAAVGDRSVDEGGLLTFTATATDDDVPAQNLAFSLSGTVPAGASITTGGVFTWTPTEAQGPGNYTFDVVVTDDGTPILSDAETITVTVAEVNTAPVLAAVGNQSVDEGSLLAFTATATDDDAPAQGLTFSLSGAVPAGASITAGGAFSWTPDESQGPGVHTFDVVVTDDGPGGLTDSETITVTVGEVNVAPAPTGVPASATIPELTLYTFDAGATDPDLPAQPLVFSLLGAPAGAAIDPGTGVFTWTPTEEQGPGTYPFTVRVTDGVANADSAVTLTVEDIALAAIADLSAALVRTGNDADGTVKVALSWTPTPPGTTVEVYRARFGQYPEFDDAGGASPATPTYPPSSPWEPTAVTAPGETDEVSNGGSGYAGRDYWQYVAFVRGPGSNVSDRSNQPATPNYLLGDVSDGTVPGLGRGDNVVDGADLSTLGASYGLTGAAVAGVGWLDVGPTSNFWVDGRPLTDNMIEFEDLVLFALNYGPGPRPQLLAEGDTAPATGDRLWIESPARVNPGQEFTVRLVLEGAGGIRALSSALAWDRAVAEPLDVEAGEWLARLGGVALSARPGTADVALVGADAPGFAGEGELARVRFRALAAGEPAVRLASAQARDAANRERTLEGATRPASAPMPAVTALTGAFPNPFRADATVAFSLVERGPVALEVYDLSGRRVRTLAGGAWEPGFHRVGWDGRDDAGRPVAPGLFFVRLTTAHGRFTARVTCLR